MCVCVCACVCVCVCVCGYTCVHAYMCAYLNMCMNAACSIYLPDASHVSDSVSSVSLLYFYPLSR